MTTQVVIHVGLHKTASTTLQKFLFPGCNEINLLLANQWNVRLFLEMVSKKDPIYFDEGLAKGLITSLILNDKVNIISSEGLSGRPWAALYEKGLDHRSDVIANLARVFPEAKIVIILRRQDGYAISFYREYLKWGGTKSIYKFIDINCKHGMSLMPLDRFNYLPYIKLLKDSFTAGVLVLPFELLTENCEAFLSKLAGFIGVKFEINALPKSNATKLGSVGLEVTRLANYLFRSYLNPSGILPGLPERHGELWRMRSPISFIHDYWPGKGSISANSGIAMTGQAILDMYRAQNAELDEMYNLDLKRYGYY